VSVNFPSGLTNIRGEPLDSKAVVADIAARDAIPQAQRYRGMQVTVQNTGATKPVVYCLETDDLTDWSVKESGGGSTDLTAIETELERLETDKLDKTDFEAAVQSDGSVEKIITLSWQEYSAMKTAGTLNNDTVYNVPDSPDDIIDGGGFPAPDWDNPVQVLSQAGTYTATADGYVQRLSGVTNSSTVYVIFSTTINGKPLEINEHEGLQSTGIYNWVSQPFPVKAGDVVSISNSGGGTHVVNGLAFYPVRR